MATSGRSETPLGETLKTVAGIIAFPCLDPTSFTPTGDSQASGRVGRARRLLYTTCRATYYNYYQPKAQLCLDWTSNETSKLHDYVEALGN